MKVHRNDVRRPDAGRRPQPSVGAAPVSAAHAIAVLLAGAVSVAVAATAAIMLGLSAALVLAIATAVGIFAAVVAHRTLSSFFAGLTLLLARPYNVGEQVRLYVPEVGAVSIAEVVHIGMVSTTLGMMEGLLVVPNTRMLRAAPECRDLAA